MPRGRVADFPLEFSALQRAGLERNTRSPVGGDRAVTDALARPMPPTKGPIPSVPSPREV
jgi:hypothetical protein